MIVVQHSNLLLRYNFTSYLLELNRKTFHVKPNTAISFSNYQIQILKSKDYYGLQIDYIIKDRVKLLFLVQFDNKTRKAVSQVECM